MKETRTDYLARISAEFPGAYLRLEQLMIQWDREHAEEMSSQDAAEAVAWDDPAHAPKIELPEPKSDNAAPEGGDAAPSEAPPETEQP